MKKKAIKSTEPATASHAERLAIIADKLKDRVLFPKKVAAAREYLQNAIAAEPESN